MVSYNRILFVLIGFLHAIIVLSVYGKIRGERLILENTTTITIPYIIVMSYVIIGLIVIGYCIAVTVLRYRLVAPASVTALAFGWATYTSWKSISTARDAGLQPILTWRLDDIYVFAWFIPLAGILVLSYVELRARGFIFG